MGRFDEFEAFDDDPPEVDHDTVGLGALARPVRLPLIVAGIAALAGAIFAATSTADFTAHLDRQVHAIHCSVMPGADAQMGESGCRTVMLSPYSSWFRSSYWGGIPVAVFALAVFAFLAYRAFHLAVKGQPRRSEVFFLLAGTGLPCLMSALFGYLAATKVGATCTVCVGMYFASGFAFAGALVAFLLTRKAPTPDPRAVRGFALGFLEGCGFVAVVFLAYLAFMPEVKAEKGRGPAGCGTLVEAADPGGVFIDLAVRPGATPSIELLDPLCPACRAFDGRLAASGLGEKLQPARRALPPSTPRATGW
ncbi:MAG: vitamin K epoxide reductase family protein [bacterium]